jgi:phosphohistidine phosphatase SixA
MLGAMDSSITALERAFELAKSGSCASVADIKRRLHEEGYSVAQVTGRALAKQLVALIEATRARTV